MANQSQPRSSNPDGPTVQIFGRENDQATRAALRFFKERRLPVHFSDLSRRSIAPGELRRFVDRLGAFAVTDTDGRAWRDAGLAYLSMDDADLSNRLLADQRLLLLPLVRHGNDVTAGRAESTWKAWAGRPQIDPQSPRPGPGRAGTGAAVIRREAS